MAKGRKRQPRELADLKGASKKDPQRYKTVPPKSNFDIGKPPNTLNKGEQAIWYEVIKYSLPGVLTGAERLTLEQLCRLIHESRNPPAQGFSVQKIGRLISILGSLGMTPVDRQRLGVQKPPKANEEEFGDF